MRGERQVRSPQAARTSVSPARRSQKRNRFMVDETALKFFQEECFFLENRRPLGSGLN